jgi:hypothetical protein
MATNPVLFEVRNNVAHVTLNRPQAGNALDVEMAKGTATFARSCCAVQPILFALAVTLKFSRPRSVCPVICARSLLICTWRSRALPGWTLR